MWTVLFCAINANHSYESAAVAGLIAKRNESRIPYDAALITARSEQLVGDMFAADFESFGYDRNKL
jgi:hypothetical protein